MAEQQASKTSTSVVSAESSSSNQHIADVPNSLPEKPPGFFIRNYRKLRDCLGFKKTYNLSLWIIFGGALFGFSLARLKSLDVDSAYKSDSVPGEYYLIKTKPFFRTSFILHLATVLPAGILTTLQFIPTIRYRYLLFHRLNGYLILLLLFIGIISGFIIAPPSFGGHLSFSTSCIVIGTSTLISLSLAYYNIKVLQIDQHRKWMLRAMFYMTAIVTSRLVGGITMSILQSAANSAADVWSCPQLESVLELPKSEFLEKYSTCRDGGKWAIVEATAGGAEGAGSALRLGFGSSLWIAFALHVVGVEVYIRLTGGENERLRMVSWERQVERGWKNAGSVGTTADRLGDAERWSSGKVRPGL